MIEGLKLKFSGIEIVEMAKASIEQIQKESAADRAKVAELRAKYPGMETEKIDEVLKSLREDAVYAVIRADNFINRLKLIVNRIDTSQDYLIDHDEVYRANLIKDDDWF